jgi:hypothetical protein
MIDAASCLRVMPARGPAISLEMRTGVPQWKEQLDVALGKEDMGAANAL